MDSKTPEDIGYDYRFLRQAARILGTFELVLLVYMTFIELKEEMENGSNFSFITMINGQYFLAVTLMLAFLGQIIAYWKEGIGGGITLTSLIVLFIGWSDFHVTFIIGMGMISVPSVLYLVYYFRVNHIKK